LGDTLPGVARTGPMIGKLGSFDRRAEFDTIHIAPATRDPSQTQYVISGRRPFTSS
jgi:hypothetical protein